MNQVLVVSSSPRGADSNTRKVAERTVAELVKRLPGIVVTERDLARDPLPHVGDAFVAGIARPPEERSPAEAAALDRSDRLVDELLAADVVVIAAPMYNFGIPSGLKAWIDHVARAGRTFRYSAAGPEGLLKGKQAILVLARGGVYTKGPMLKFDFQESYLRTVLGFLGLTDVRVIHVEGVAMGPETAQAALAQALAQAANVIRIPVAETALAA